MHAIISSTLLLSATIANGAVLLRDPHGPGNAPWDPFRLFRKPSGFNVQVGPRPYFLIEDMDDGALKKKLSSCSESPLKVTDFSIAHRGAALQFPEHTIEAWDAARRQGAGIIECDVAFTSDKQLVCRHSQCDLHYTTDILARPELAAKCSVPFTPAQNGTSATAKCCTSDITVEEFKTLCGKMEGMNSAATTVEEYLDGTPAYRTDLYATCGKVATHAEFIELVDSWGLKFTSELKEPEVPMPFDGYTQEQYAQDLIDEYKAAKIKPSRVWPQSFVPEDIFYWIDNEPEFAKQAVYLDERVDTKAGYEKAVETLKELKERGVRIMAPAMFALVKLDDKKNIVPSEYAVEAKKAGLKMIAWSLERSGFLKNGGGYYYDSVKEVINNDGDMYKVVDVLARKVGVDGIFSDWPATVTYYASCFGLK